MRKTYFPDLNCRSFLCFERFIHVSLQFVCFLCPCLGRSTFHLLALLANFRTDDAECYVKSIIAFKNFPIDTLLISHLESRYLAPEIV